MYKVLIVEDDPTVRRGLCTTIRWEELRCRVVGEAPNGEEGVEMAEKFSPDIVITDVKMPRMDGVEMIRQLRKNGCQARFIILTAYSDFGYAQSAIRLGVSDYLLKPLRDGAIEEAVQAVTKADRPGTEERPVLPDFAGISRPSTWTRRWSSSAAATGRISTSAWSPATWICRRAT